MWENKTPHHKPFSGKMRWKIWIKIYFLIKKNSILSIKPKKIKWYLWNFTCKLWIIVSILCKIFMKISWKLNDWWFFKYITILGKNVKWSKKICLHGFFWKTVWDMNICPPTTHFFFYYYLYRKKKRSIYINNGDIICLRVKIYVFLHVL